jgi:hypothetical protein
MTEEKRRDLKERFLGLIVKMVNKKISLNTKIKEQIGHFLDCLSDIITNDPNDILDKLEELIKEQEITQKTKKVPKR